MTPQPPIDDILTITGLNGDTMHYIDHNRACWRGGRHFIEQNRDLEGGGLISFVLTITGIHCVWMIPHQIYSGGILMKHKLTKIGNLPYFGQFGPILRKALIPSRGSQGPSRC